MAILKALADEITTARNVIIRFEYALLVMRYPFLLSLPK